MQSLYVYIYIYIVLLKDSHYLHIVIPEDVLVQYKLKILDY